MKINFTQVLQDSWHFFRNQQKTMLRFVSILLIVQIASALFSPSLISQETLPADAKSLDLTQINAVGFLTSFIITQLITTFIGVWGLMTIHQISQQNYRTLGESLKAALPRFVGIIILEIIMVTPMVLGLSEISVAYFTKADPSMMSLFAIIVGIWFFIRLNLSTVHYLTTQDGIGQSLQKIWLQGRNQKGALFIYALLVYFIVPILVFQLAAIFNNAIFTIIIGMLASALNILMLVVTYRFYSLFMKES